MPMATEMNSLFDAIALTSCRTVGTTAGLTDTNTTSDPSTTGPLLVIVFTPNDCNTQLILIHKIKLSNGLCLTLNASILGKSDG